MSRAHEQTKRTATDRHWPEYFIEAAGLGCFMVSACLFAVLLMHPDSPAVDLVASPLVRRFLMGLAMGTTAMLLVYSPWGRRSGAHFNPALTLAFLHLGRIRPRDAACYAGMQFAGGIMGVLLAASILGDALRDAAVRYVATVPGAGGAGRAFAAEFSMSFGLMTVVLAVSNSRWTRWTGVIAGIVVATYISLWAPVSGMSMNPARTLASAIPARAWNDVWIYFVAPPAGMLSAAHAFLRLRGADGLGCPKIDRVNRQPCIFCGSATGHAH